MCHLEIIYQKMASDMICVLWMKRHIRLCGYTLEQINWIIYWECGVLGNQPKTLFILKICYRKEVYIQIQDENKAAIYNAGSAMKDLRELM